MTSTYPRDFVTIPKTPIAEFLENAQNPCLTESPNPKIFETCTESLCHLFHLIQNIWMSRRTSVRPNKPGPEFLDHPQNFCVTEYRFQNFWNMGKCYLKPKHQFISRICGTCTNALCDAKHLIQKIWMSQNFCTTQNTDSRISGKCTKPFSDGKPQSRNF